MTITLDGTLGITSPAETVQGALTTTGNTILGDATTDTLTVGVTGIVKDASGNVGIGTASPGAKLDVAGELRVYPSTTPAVIRFGVSAVEKGKLAVDSSSNMLFETAGAERMRIDSSGNVGIGTATPFPSTAHPSASQLRVGLTGNYFSQNSTGLGIAGASFIDNAYIKNSTGDFAYITSAKASKVLCNTGGVLFQTSTGTDIADTATSFATQAGITAAGLFQFNSGYGSAATAYGCRAWVNFNGTGTVAIRASGNVSSITDGGTGTYTVNFTTAMPDANYVVFGNTTRDPFAAAVAVRGCTPHTLATGSVSVPTFNLDAAAAVVLEDLQYISVSIFR